MRPLLVANSNAFWGVRLSLWTRENLETSTTHPQEDVRSLGLSGSLLGAEGREEKSLPAGAAIAPRGCTEASAAAISLGNRNPSAQPVRDITKATVGLGPRSLGEPRRGALSSAIPMCQIRSFRPLSPLSSQGRAAAAELLPGSPLPPRQKGGYCLCRSRIGRGDDTGGSSRHAFSLTSCSGSCEVLWLPPLTDTWQAG